MKQMFIKTLACLTVIALSIQLSGCAVAGMVAGGSLIYHHKAVENYVADKKITMAANKLLQSDQELHANSHLIVEVDHGMVLLVGETSTEALKKRAEAMVQSIEGITRVYNQIALAPPISWMQKSKDAAITGKIKLAMLSDSSLDASAIKIITENKAVYLMGVLTHAQADRAVTLAKKTRNVSKVVKVVQYITVTDA